MSEFLLSVAEVLPLPHRAVAPYTLGEAVAELGAYAGAISAVEWNSPHKKKNRSELHAEIDAQTQSLGNLLGTSMGSLLPDLCDSSDQEAVIDAAARFSKEWHSEGAIADAFSDLSGAAKVLGTTSRALRTLSDIIASQVGPAAVGTISLLSHAADALIETEEDLARWRDVPIPGPVPEARRLEIARDILTSAAEGRVTVWVAYYRAILSDMRAVAGPITFLRADWALPNAFEVELSDFPERAELRKIRKDVTWLDDLLVEAYKPENRLALVRVDLGDRQVAGAVEEAQRRISAILSIAVQAGGVSWQGTGAVAVLLDGKVRSSSLGVNLYDAPALGDNYGMGATAEMLANVVGQLDTALTKAPMPEHLVEALASLREARMTDHRDVLSYGARRVTPRVATALEDHAMELIASTLQVHPLQLAEALQRREALDQADRRTAEQLTAPFNDDWSRESHEGRRELQRRIFDDSQGRRLVSVANVVAHQAEISALPMSSLERADFQDALAICTDPERERQLLDDVWRETSLLRARHRRVRNAVNHGLPLDAVTLNSIRDYADRTSSIALNIALTWFKDGEPGELLLQREQLVWTERMDRIERGLSWAVEDRRIHEES